MHYLCGSVEQFLFALELEQAHFLSVPIFKLLLFFSPWHRPTAKLYFDAAIELAPPDTPRVDAASVNRVAGIFFMPCKIILI